MADEVKKCKCNVSSVLKFLLGIAVILLGVFLTIRSFDVLKIIFFGCLGPFLILVGLIIVAIAKE